MSTRHRRKPYMPDSDLGKRNWMERFIKHLETDPKRFGFDDPGAFERVQQTVREFITAHDAVANKALRSPSKTRAKNQAREKAVALCREIAMRLKQDPTITDNEKDSLGIRIEVASPQEAKLPAGALAGTLGYPELVVKNSPNGGHVIQYRDPNSSSKGKPDGVSHLLLFGAIGEKPKMRSTHARLLGAPTKWPIEIMYPTGCGIEGLYVTYYGRWLTTRGEIGPWSVGVSVIIGAALVSLRECAFSHLFGEEGFVDALPQLPEGAERGAGQLEAQGVVRIDEDHPLLEGGGSDGDALFSAIGQLEAATVRLLEAE